MQLTDLEIQHLQSLLEKIRTEIKETIEILEETSKKLEREEKWEHSTALSKAILKLTNLFFED
jgi:hypothetical protein